MKFTKRAEVSHGGNDKYLKFKDGESKNLVLRGEIYEFYMKWVNGKSQDASPQDPEAKSRFKVNAVFLESGVFAAKVWEFPLTVYNQLASINEEYPLERTKIKVTRQGTGTDTVYHILPLVAEKDQLTLAMQGKLAEVQMHILDSKPKVQELPSNGWDKSDPGPSSDELPF